MTEKRCALKGCGNWFTPNSNRHKYCSPVCRNISKRRTPKRRAIKGGHKVGHSPDRQWRRDRAAMAQLFDGGCKDDGGERPITGVQIWKPGGEVGQPTRKRPDLGEWMGSTSKHIPFKMPGKDELDWLAAHPDWWKEV